MKSFGLNFQKKESSPAKRKENIRLSPQKMTKLSFEALENKYLLSHMSLADLMDFDLENFGVDLFALATNPSFQ